jgi:hypothetical protein
MAMPKSLSPDEKRLVRSHYKPKNSQHPINIFSKRSDQKHPPRIPCQSRRVVERRREVRLVRTWRKHLNNSQAVFIGHNELCPKSMPMRHEASVARTVYVRDFPAPPTQTVVQQQPRGAFLA